MWQWHYTQRHPGIQSNLEFLKPSKAPDQLTHFQIQWSLAFVLLSFSIIRRKSSCFRFLFGLGVPEVTRARTKFPQFKHEHDSEQPTATYEHVDLRFPSLHGDISVGSGFIFRLTTSTTSTPCTNDCFSAPILLPIVDVVIIITIITLASSSAGSFVFKGSQYTWRPRMKLCWGLWYSYRMYIFPH